jgi:hypothetical protein
MLDINILCVGIIRNGETSLRRSVTTLDQAFGFAQKRQWLVIESDSADNTIGVLSDLQKEIPFFSFLSLGFLKNILPERTHRIAHCRNACLDEISSNPLFKDVEYVVMADLDGVNDALDWKAALSCWTRTDWDACFANQTGAYYDIWALRHPIWSPNDCWEMQSFLESNGIDPIYSSYASIVSRMIEIAPDGPWIEVDSAFGGLGIYRRSILENIRFDGVSLSGQRACEWVSFNQTLRTRGYKLFINPKMINGGFNEHSEIYQQILEQTRKIKKSHYGVQS